MREQFQHCAAVNETDFCVESETTDLEQSGKYRGLLQALTQLFRVHADLDQQMQEAFAAQKRYNRHLIGIAETTSKDLCRANEQFLQTEHLLQSKIDNVRLKEQFLEEKIRNAWSEIIQARRQCDCLEQTLQGLQQNISWYVSQHDEEQMQSREQIRLAESRIALLQNKLSSLNSEHEKHTAISEDLEQCRRLNEGLERKVAHQATDLQNADECNRRLRNELRIARLQLKTTENDLRQSAQMTLQAVAQKNVLAEELNHWKSKLRQNGVDGLSEGCNSTFDKSEEQSHEHEDVFLNRQGIEYDKTYTVEIDQNANYDLKNAPSVASSRKHASEREERDRQKEKDAQSANIKRVYPTSGSVSQHNQEGRKVGMQNAGFPHEQHEEQEKSRHANPSPENNDCVECPKAHGTDKENNDTLGVGRKRTGRQRKRSVPDGDQCTEEHRKGKKSVREQSRERSRTRKIRTTSTVKHRETHLASSARDTDALLPVRLIAAESSADDGDDWIVDTDAQSKKVQ